MDARTTSCGAASVIATAAAAVLFVAHSAVARNVSAADSRSLSAAAASLWQPSVETVQVAQTSTLDTRRDSPKAIEKSIAVYSRNCTTTGMYLGYLHDCECLTQGARKVLEAKGRSQVSPEDQAQLGQTCPAAKNVTYDWVYQTCDGYMKSVRSDHGEFCACTAEHFAVAFRSHPNSNLRKVEALKAESMKACSLGGGPRQSKP